MLQAFVVAYTSTRLHDKRKDRMYIRANPYTKKNIRRGKREETRDEEEARVCRDKKKKEKKTRKKRKRCVYFCNVALSRIALFSMCIHITRSIEHDAACTCKHVHTSSLRSQRGASCGMQSKTQQRSCAAYL